MDYSFLRLKDNLKDALNIGDSPISDQIFYCPIQLLPNKAYTQITNFTDGISLDSDCEVFVVNRCGKIRADITDRVFIEEFNKESDGTNQCKIELVNLNVDFYREPVLLYFKMLTSNAEYYSNPINITAYEEELTTFFKYKNYDDFEGIGYTNANVWQSVSLNLYFDIPLDETETEDYFQISRNNTISARALRKLFEQYQIDKLNRFTFDRLNLLLKHELIYLEDVRVTNKPTVSSADREGNSNFFTTNLIVAKNYNDVSPYAYQVFDGLYVTNYSPQGNFTNCDLLELVITFNRDITLNTGFISVYDADDNSNVATYTEADMSVENNVLTVDVPLLGELLEEGNYYFNVSCGLVDAIGVNYIGITDGETWTLNISEGDYDSEDYGTDYSTNCPEVLRVFNSKFNSKFS